jgi:GMP synthase-like glutamine amidotransferase
MPAPLPGSLHDGGHHAIVVMGGTMGAYETERHRFLGEEKRLLAEALATGRPALGVCLGSQLLAAAAGARAYPGPVTEVGWLPVKRLAEDPWLPEWPEVFEPLQWHGDTFDLPPHATRLASSEAYVNQAFRLGSGLGLQFHVEATGAMARDWWTSDGIGERWRPPAGHVERSEEAAARMGPLVQSLGRAFAEAAERSASGRR